MTARRRTTLMQCTLCEKLFRTKSPVAFTTTMRRHRKTAHSGHRGPIRYTTVL